MIVSSNAGGERWRWPDPDELIDDDGGGGVVMVSGGCLAVSGR